MSTSMDNIIDDVSEVRSKKTVTLMLATYSKFTNGTHKNQNGEQIKLNKPQSTFIYRHPGDVLKQTEVKTSPPKAEGSRRKACFKRCYICHQCCIDWPDYLLHMKIHFPSDPPIQCNLCQKTFQSFCLFLHHHQTHKASGRVKAHFQAKHKLTCHQVNKNDRRFSCTVCQYITSKSSDLQHHMRRHFINEQPRFHCSVCNLKFIDRADLYMHTRTNRHVYRAERAGLQDALPEKLSCRECSYFAYSKWYLSKHVKSHHPNMILDPVQKPPTNTRKKNTRLQKFVVIHSPSSSSDNPPPKPSTTVPLLRSLLLPDIPIPSRHCEVIADNQWSQRLPKGVEIINLTPM